MLQQKMHGNPLVYLDSAATALKPRQVIDPLAEFYLHRYATVNRAIYELSVGATFEYQQARAKVQRLLNASCPEEIIFTRGTTESINLVASCVSQAILGPNTKILLTEMEHHSNIVPWQLCQKMYGFEIEVIPIDEDGTLAFAPEMITEQTAFVSLTHISNVLGTINPLKEIIAAAHAKGAYVLVDGAQSAPHLPIDVSDLDCDFFVFSGHKLFGPNGIGALYAKKELLEKLPPYQGGGDMIEHVTFAKTTFNTPPLKFEAGTPIIAEAISLGHAVDYISALGIQKIHDYEQALLTYTLDKLHAIDRVQLLPAPSNKSSLISFNVEGVHHLDLGTLLDFKGIAIRTGHHCAQPLMHRLGITGCLRLSLAFYNTQEDIDRFIKALKESLQQFGDTLDCDRNKRLDLN